MEHETSHIEVLKHRHRRERERLKTTTSPHELEIRRGWVARLEKEIREEIERLGIRDESGNIEYMTDEELLEALGI